MEVERGYFSWVGQGGGGSGLGRDKGDRTDPLHILTPVSDLKALHGAAQT